MKKYFVIFIIALSILLCSCGGNVNNVQVDIGESSLYSSEEIEKAADVAIKYFKRNFSHCDMTRIAYSEEKTIAEKKYTKGTHHYISEDIMTFVSDFDVDDTGCDGSLSPNQKVRGWQWILARDDGGNWVLVNYGFD